LSALAPISGTSYAIAEERVESRSRIDEVIVTARKRAELLTEVPMTITAVSGEILMERGITSITSLPEVTSGLTVSVNANSQVSFRVRGLGSETSSESFEQSVPLFIDGMYQGRSQSYVQSMFDIAQVEIVKGTESSLLGKNTSLGAVSLTTRKPGDELAFNVTTSYEFELDSHNIESGVDIPLANNMALRLAGQVRKQGGWVENPLLGEDYPETKSVAGRGVFVWEPSSDLDITLLYQRFDTKTLGQPEEIVTDLSGGGRARAEVAGYFDFETNLNYVNASSDPGFGTTKDNMVGNAAIATINYDIDGYTLTSVSSYSDYDLFKPFDADLLPGRWAAYDPINQDSKQLTQELRISSPAEGRFNYVAGLFYLTEEWHQDRIWLNPATPPNGLTGEMLEQTDIELETFSAFGQMNYDITEQFGLTLGLRYTDEERTADFIRETIVSGLLTSFLFPEINGNKTRTESHVDGSIGFQYTPNETVLYYASFSRGTKGGGFLNLPTSIAASEFEEEQADTIELG